MFKSFFYEFIYYSYALFYALFVSFISLAISKWCVKYIAIAMEVFRFRVLNKKMYFYSKNCSINKIVSFSILFLVFVYRASSKSMWNTRLQVQPRFTPSDYFFYGYLFVSCGATAVMKMKTYTILLSRKMRKKTYRI